MKTDVIMGLVQKMSIETLDKVLARHPSDGVLLLTMGGQACKYIGNGMAQTLAGGVIDVTVSRIESISLGFRGTPDEEEYKDLKVGDNKPDGIDPKLLGLKSK